MKEAFIILAILGLILFGWYHSPAMVQRRARRERVRALRAWYSRNESTKPEPDEVLIASTKPITDAQN